MSDKMKIKHLADILGKLDATTGEEGAAQAVARYTLDQLRGFGGPAPAEDVKLDVQFLADTLEAYAFLLRTSGVIPDGEIDCLTEEH